jgi:MFS superfamily sulfate permease-like transporter
MSAKLIFNDLKSGVVVFLVALPLCLGVALACNAPLISGIISGITGGILVTLFSDSKLSVSGPAAGLTSIVLASVVSLGGFNYFLAAIILAGTLQIALGFMKAGGVGNYLPNAVIKGMLAGIGLILIFKQVPHIVGYDRDPEGDMEFWQQDGENTISELLNSYRFFTPGPMLAGTISFVLLWVSSRRFYRADKILSMIPGPLLVVICGILFKTAFDGNPAFRIGADHLVDLPLIRSISDFRESIPGPDFSHAGSYEFWNVVVALALVASLESLLGIEAVQKIDPDKNLVNSNRELIAQGIGNIASGLAGGLPVTSVIIRSSANISSGAKTKLSAIFHALLLLCSVLIIPQVLMLIPNSCLAAILISAGYKLAGVSLFRTKFRRGMDQFFPFLTTILVMLLSDLLKGVAAGIVVSVFFIIRNSIRTSFETHEEKINGVVNHLIKLPQHITFFNKGFIIRYLRNIHEGSRVIIDGSITRSTDKDVREALLDFVENSRLRNIRVQLVKYELSELEK